ncbi:MAG: sugar transferase [Acidimicrobiales bacterium]
MTTRRLGHEVTKRGLDIVVGAALFMLAVPVIAVAAIGAAVALRSWPFFVHERIGRGGTTFRFVKIRTLPKRFEPYADKYTVADAPIPVWCQRLRRHKIDELPQLLHAASGRMSLVGPRPEMPDLHARFDPTFAARRTTVRPGCTGLWQLSTDCTGLIGEAPHWDLLYVHQRNLMLDLWLLARTVRLLLGGPHIRLDDVPGWALRTDGRERSAVLRHPPDGGARLQHLAVEALAFGSDGRELWADEPVAHRHLSLISDRRGRGSEEVGAFMSPRPRRVVEKPPLDGSDRVRVFVGERNEGPVESAVDIGHDITERMNDPVERGDHQAIQVRQEATVEPRPPFEHTRRAVHGLTGQPRRGRVDGLPHE